ncbi:MAG TPA: hypothetical protein VE442_04900 [Jatrophihabitans sp.]|nr:hypothetical protein [Jatrophihabitans sp.]
MTQYLAVAKQVVDLYPGIKSIVSDSRPVLTTHDVAATAIPHGADPMNMVAQGTNVRVINYKADWEIPYVTDWSTTAKIKLAWAFGARYEGGGAYIPAVYSWCEEIDPSTGQDLNITIEAGQPYVQGEENSPYAVLPVKITCHEESLTDTHNEVHEYLLYGYGPSQQL